VQDEVFAVNSGQGSVSSFSIGTGGAITQNTTPAADYSGQDVAITPDHQYLYTANTYAGTITAFLVGSYGDLAQIGQPVPATPTSNTGISAGPNDLEVAPDGDYLFVADTCASEVSSFKIGSDGALTYIGAYATGDIAGTGFPASLVIAPDGDFLYVYEIEDSYFTSFSIDSDGVLDNLGNSSAWPNCGAAYNGGVSAAAAILPSGDAIYLASGACIFWYTVNGATLTIQDEQNPIITGTSQTAADEAGGLSISPDGSYLYSANYQQDTINAYSIDQSGTPTSLGAPIAARVPRRTRRGSLSPRRASTRTISLMEIGSSRAVSIRRTAAIGTPPRPPMSTDSGSSRPTRRT
jgi:6-phosphogluconolactonase (cycloisomerase 2 family)